MVKICVDISDCTSQVMPIFNLKVPVSVKGVPRDVLLPQRAWSDQKQLEQQLLKLGGLFIENFKLYQDRATPEVVATGPVLH